MRNQTYKTNRLSFKAMIMCFMMVFTVMLSSMTVLADITAEQARVNLTNYVQAQLSQNTYETEKGGFISGKELFDGNQTKGFDLREDVFESLTSDGQTLVVGDIAKASNAKVGEDGVTDQTVQEWWKTLQTKSGVGTKFLNTILAGTKPDFVTANAIWQPFSGPVGTILGLISIAVMALIGIVMAADIMYITIPPIRILVSDDENGDRVAKSKVFSHDALYAVQKAESDSDGGTPKQALGIYLRRRIGSLFLLGIVLMYLVQGQLYVAVGWFLDLLNGFLGF